MPRFSFGITLYEYLNLMVLPGLEAFVHYFIRDILLRPYILPESITVPLTVRDSALSQGVIMHTNTRPQALPIFGAASMCRCTPVQDVWVR